jgi:hypothetical protein
MASFTDQVVSNQLNSGDAAASATAGSGGSVFDLLKTGVSRLAGAGLNVGGVPGLPKSIPNIGTQSLNQQGGATAPAEDDWRVRVSLAPGAYILYQDIGLATNSLMYPLVETNGVIWPYTPQISVTHNANYATAQLTHSNYPAHFYNYSEVADIQISGEFTVQTPEDGQYLMAAVYFFRSATKMFFGSGANVGNPPPIVFLDGYGSHYFPHVPCVITSFNHVLPNEADYLSVPITTTSLEDSGATTFTPTTPNSYVQDATNVPSLLQSSTQATTDGTKAIVKAGNTMRYNSIETHTRVPTTSTISVTLRPMYSRSNIHNRFNMSDFAQGKLIKDSKTGNGGFL